MNLNFAIWIKTQYISSNLRQIATTPGVVWKIVQYFFSFLNKPILQMECMNSRMFLPLYCIKRMWNIYGSVTQCYHFQFPCCGIQSTEFCYQPWISCLPPSFRLKGEQIRLCTALRYLGLWFDGKLTFKEHAKRTAAKAERIVASISRLMLNLGRPSKGKRKLLANVAMSVLLYGAPIWADARQYRRTEMVLVQRKAALRCVSAYRTISTEAVCMLAGIPWSR